MTQKEMVLEHLRTNGSITSMDAIMKYGITRLSDVILKLRREGYDIETVTESGKNRYGKATTFGRYQLNEG